MRIYFLILLQNKRNLIILKKNLHLHKTCIRGIYIHIFLPERNLLYSCRYFLHRLLYPTSVCMFDGVDVTRDHGYSTLSSAQSTQKSDTLLSPSAWSTLPSLSVCRNENQTYVHTIDYIIFTPSLRYDLHLGGYSTIHIFVVGH